MNVISQSSPDASPIDYASLVIWLRLDNNDERSLIEDLIDAAVEFAEQSMGTSLITRTITAKYYEAEPIYLPRGPVQSITSIQDKDGHDITDYDLQGFGRADYIKINSMSGGYPVTVEYEAGYGDDAADVPADIRSALRAHVGTLYKYRESLADGTKPPISVPHQLEEFYRLKSRETGIG